MSTTESQQHKDAVTHARAAIQKGDEMFWAVRCALRHAYGEDAGNKLIWSAMGGDPGKEILALYKALGYEVSQ